MAQTKYKLVIEGVNKTKKAFGAVTRSLAKVGGAAKSAAKVVGGIGLAVAAVGAAFVAMGKKAFDALDSIGKTASRTGFAAKTLQALRLGAVESGASVEGLNKAIEKFSKNIGDVIVKGTGEASYALDRMGISLYNNQGILKSNDRIFREVSDGIKLMSDETERNSVLQGMFGRQGILMNQVFAEGAEGIDRWIKKASEMGIIINDKSLKAIENFNDRFAELQFMLNGLINQTFAALAPGLEKIITHFKDWAVDAQETGTNLEDLGKIIAEKLVVAFATLVETIGVVGKSIIDFTNKTAFQLAKLAYPLAMINGNFVRAQELWDKTRVPPAISEFDKEMKELANSIREFFKDLGSGSLDDFITEIEVCLKPITQLEQRSTAFGEGFKKAIETASMGLDDFSNLGIKVAKTLEDGLAQAFMNIGDGLESLKDLFKNIVNMIVSELIRINIARPLVGAISGMFKAGGGPVSAGKPYIVGERGPELFVPGSSGGIVPNNKLGGSVVINQSINFATGVVPTVRAEVIKMLPQISEVTKAAVAESSMRGGAYRRALTGG